MKKPSCSAFTLVEVALALGVASFCLLSIMGLFPVALATQQRSSAQTRAVSILSGVTSDLRSSSPALTSNQVTNTGILALSVPVRPFVGTNQVVRYSDASGKLTEAQDQNSLFEVRVAYLPDASPVPTGSPGTARVSVRWPPSQTHLNSVESLVVFRRD